MLELVIKSNRVVKFIQPMKGNTLHVEFCGKKVSYSLTRVNVKHLKKASFDGTWLFLGTLKVNLYTHDVHVSGDLFSKQPLERQYFPNTRFLRKILENTYKEVMTVRFLNNDDTSVPKELSGYLQNDPLHPDQCNFVAKRKSYSIAVKSKLFQWFQTLTNLKDPHGARVFSLHASLTHEYLTVKILLHKHPWFSYEQQQQYMHYVYTTAQNLYIQTRQPDLVDVIRRYANPDKTTVVVSENEISGIPHNPENLDGHEIVSFSEERLEGLKNPHKFDFFNTTDGVYEPKRCRNLWFGSSFCDNYGWGIVLDYIFQGYHSITHVTSDESNFKPAECTICMEPILNALVLGCVHGADTTNEENIHPICETCALQLIENKCPTCRKENSLINMNLPLNKKGHLSCVLSFMSAMSTKYCKHEDDIVLVSGLGKLLGLSKPSEVLALLNYDRRLHCSVSLNRGLAKDGSKVVGIFVLDEVEYSYDLLKCAEWVQPSDDPVTIKISIDE